MTISRTLSIHTLGGLPLFTERMSVAHELVAAIQASGHSLQDGDVCVIAQKIISKVEGRALNLSDVSVGENARTLAASTRRDSALMQAILDESREILRSSPAAVIARHRTGHVLANAGIDASNVYGGDEDKVLLWPVEPDASARSIRREIRHLTGAAVAVIIADSMGRAWRIGTTGHAIGCAGLVVVEDRRGKAEDLYGRTLQATQIAVADSLAAMAVLAMGEGDEGTPVAIIRGAELWVTQEDGPGAVVGLRPTEQDMFR
ncbi:coenzyme F420-0:L-glutamate ligase/coenzyme F420-1:gamma-L-glutamate ligase [Sphingobium sp. OAS761]|uniref:coenzyme F420-0:L-glutamate ligase n=1 Tax=Sphingobium sp. OAS761 TaxID=2817901 RepID=UPI00209D1EDF|nr:coenzyme F420-0:L-glutamate ligase [Sphingobium sp. OAS761]MCP1471303.1 coenzyme F420-0:L-glutamate ligase/coenzyme F420-1:gamma-L-glutamate ligase [Sphingobium sp. OAS761]